MSVIINLRIFWNKRPIFTKVTKQIHFSYDYVTLYDGGSIFAPQLGRYCNNSLPPTRHSGELIQNYKCILATGVFKPSSALLQVPRNYGKRKQKTTYWKTKQIFGHQMMNLKLNLRTSIFWLEMLQASRY